MKPSAAYLIPAMIRTKTHDLLDIMDYVSQEGKVSSKLIRSRLRTQHIANIRHIFCYLSLTYTSRTQKEIGAIIGRDHATVLAGRNKVKNLLKVDRMFRERYGKIITKYNNYA